MIEVVVTFRVTKHHAETVDSAIAVVGDVICAGTASDRWTYDKDYHGRKDYHGPEYQITKVELTEENKGEINL